MSTEPILLILGGTSGARVLAAKVAEAGVNALYSYAGRTMSPEPMPIPTRIGGFGGPEGLAQYILDTGITHVVDATHPFAVQMSLNAIDATRASRTPLLALTRPPWTPVEGDAWIKAPDMDAVIAALNTDPQRVFLAIGRKEVRRFTARPQHHYLLRLVDPPQSAPPLPSHDIVIDKGPFTEAGDRALLEKYRINMIVSKNSGGSGARAKLDAARALGLPVLMIDRPHLPARDEVHEVGAVLDWLGHGGAERGV